MIVHDKPEAEYHADRSTLSSTGAKTLIRSPRQFRYQLDHPKRSTPSMMMGTLTHALVFDQPHTFTPKDWDGRTKIGKEREAEVTKLGLTPISADDWRTAHAMADAVRSNSDADGLFSDGRAEVSAYGTDPETGVAMRGRFDWWRDDGRIIDLKTTEDASPSGFARSVASFRYHLQADWYPTLGGLNDCDVDEFVFVVVEKDSPHLVGIYRLDAAALTAGRKLAMRAREVYRDCVEAEGLFGLDAWPDWGPSNESDTLSLPRWALNEADAPIWV